MAWTVTDRLSVIWTSDLTDKMKRSFFQAAVVSILLYGCTTWTLTKQMEKKLDGNYTRMLRAILNKSLWQRPKKQQLYGHLPPITKIIQIRRTRHAGHCWRSSDELISDVLLWTPSHGRANAGWPARTYIQQLCEDTGRSPEELPEAMNDREWWKERVRNIRAEGTVRWWWRWWLNLVVWPRWSVCFPRSTCVSFSRRDSVLCLYHLFVWSNFNFLLNSQWITLPTQSCLVLYSFCVNLLHSIIMWLIVSSLSPHNLHLLFCCVLSILALI